ncbi:MAG: hypothetical protein AAF519_11765 [Bacteroidota bacterium]
MFKYLYFVVIIMSVSCTTTKKSAKDKVEVFRGPVVSCGNASIFQLNNEKNRYILVKLDMSNIDSSTRVEIGDPGVTVSLVKFDGDVSNRPCNDVMDDAPKEISSQQAQHGDLEVTISPEELEKKRSGAGYRIHLESSNITFPDGFTFAVSIHDAYVGWLPG